MSSHRLENTTTCLPIAYGSVAFYLGKKSDEYHTHRWTLYVRSPNNTTATTDDNNNNSDSSSSSTNTNKQQFDLSAAISKVVFQLHPSFARPTRELTEPPYEVTETGWGEFEASIRIIWKECSEERSTILTHGIRLYPNRAPATSADPSAYMNTTVPVVSEKYDEVVFTNPKAEFHQSILNGYYPKDNKNNHNGNNNNKQQQQQQQQLSHLPYPLSNEPSVIAHFRTYGDEDDVKAMLVAKQFLEGELATVKERLLRVDGELEEVKRDLVLWKKMSAEMAASSSSASMGGMVG
eukprot:CAMPEP_0183711198 /NCGR_PEP_ID=MMETSP0737-20130205/6761_1 /TAXON_ID=385413 /ORGANISM="Thalassiosira miniscula, Strain CCMP1093" /LENGTH=292 /DNA_ID=CAMNT_0025939649 /DNA_START=51 /DNA_END=925 /DNA_ORIENTATION=-